MSTRKTRPTMREIDLILARTLKKVRQLEARVATQRIAVRTYPRTRTPGPLTYARMSTGQLAMAALAGTAIYHWSEKEQSFFEKELQSRGLSEALKVWQGNEPSTELKNTTIPETPRFDALIDRITVLTSNGLDNLAGAVDEVILGGDGRVRTALSPAEVIEDMHLAGMNPEIIAAFEEGVGTSTVSLTEEIGAQGFSGIEAENPFSHEPAHQEVHTL